MIEPPDYLQNYLIVPRPVQEALEDDPIALAVYMAIARRARFETGVARTKHGDLVSLEAGQALFGRAEIAGAIRTTEKSVRTAIVGLQKLGFLAIRSSRRGSVVTLLGYIASSARAEVRERVAGQQNGAFGPTGGQQEANRLATNEDLKKGKKERRSEPREVSEDALRLAQLLHELITNRSPQLTIAKRTDSERAKECQRWAIDIDNLHRIDGISFEHIERVVRWCQADPFWHANILSGRKLREKYNQLEAQRARNGAPPAARNGHGRAEPASAEQHAAYVGKDNPFS